MEATLKPVIQLDGVWVNQLGSRVIFHTKSRGRVTGEYGTQVSSNGSPLRGHVLRGTYQVLPNAEKLISWTVQWQVPMPDGSTKYSTTAWTGYLSGTTITASWILTSANEPEWKRTNIGFDTFTRV